MTLADYYDLLAQHDWLYEFSDDTQVYMRGHRERSEIIRLRAADPERGELYRQFYKYHFSGPPFNTERQPKPERPEDT